MEQAHLWFLQKTESRNTIITEISRTKWLVVTKRGEFVLQFNGKKTL